MKVKAKGPKVQQPKLKVTRRAPINKAVTTTNHEGYECIGNVSGNSTNFLLLGNSAYVPGYDINPTSAMLFPWLSQVSKSFEKYKSPNFGSI